MQLRLTDAAGADVLPVLWSDNYVTLFPGDRRTIGVRIPGGAIPAGAHVEAHGLNVGRVATPVGRLSCARG